MESRGDIEVKVTLSGLVRLLKELRVFQEPALPDLELPETALQAILPQWEEKAKANARRQVMVLADENFLKVLVLENREKIEELLAQDIPTV